jgi:hypothetical protein
MTASAFAYSGEEYHAWACSMVGKASMLTCTFSGWFQSASSTSGLAPRAIYRPPSRAISRAAICLYRSHCFRIQDLHLSGHVSGHAILRYRYCYL